MNNKALISELEILKKIAFFNEDFNTFVLNNIEIFHTSIGSVFEDLKYINLTLQSHLNNKIPLMKELEHHEEIIKIVGRNFKI